MKIAVIGADYVGTVISACFAELGHTVITYDKNKVNIENLNKGVYHSYEPGLSNFITTNIADKRLKFTTSLEEAVKPAEIVFLCIENGLNGNSTPEVSVQDIVAKVASFMDSYKLIVEKSTYSIKGSEWLKSVIQSNIKEGVKFNIAADPQFLREGNAIDDFFKPDRIVLGVDSDKALDILVKLYTPLNAPMLITDINSAELIKHASNTFLAMKISFINTLADICEKIGADIKHVSRGVGLDKRIGEDFLQAGIGYGGRFFPSDIQALLDLGPSYNIKLDMIEQVATVNRYQRLKIINKLEKCFENKDLKNKTIAVWGLTYKPETDDMRDSPSINILNSLEKRKVKIKAYDPKAMDKAKELLKFAEFFPTPYEAAHGADAIMILTEWEEFKKINFQELKQATNCRIIVDGRNIYDPATMEMLGFKYVSFGQRKFKKSL